MDTTSIRSKDAKIIGRLAKEGKTIHEIGERLKDRYEYRLIQAYMWEHDCITLQGAKKAVSIRLRKLPSTRQEADRRQLVVETQDFVDYIYYACRGMQAKLEKARKDRVKLKRLLEAE